jgi:predicted HicB family RNase H-like nuclease
VKKVPQTKKEIRNKYDKKTYKQYTLTVRRNSELYEKLEETVKLKGASLNNIIKKLLAEYYEVSIPDAHNDIK